MIIQYLLMAIIFWGYLAAACEQVGGGGAWKIKTLLMKLRVSGREREIWTDEDKNVILIEWPDVDGGELHQQNKTFSFDRNVFTFSKQFINNSMLNLIFYITLNESESIHFTLSCSLSRVGHQKLFNQNSSKPYS